MNLSHRNLRKSDLGAVIFGCTHSTMKECLTKQLFGLPGEHFAYVKNIDIGLPLFLFNYNDRNLHGVFDAASAGRLNIDPYAWTPDGSSKTRFSAQVQVRVLAHCQPLSEKQFRPIIADNYYKHNHIWFELDHDQASKLISLFLSQPQPTVPRGSLPQRSSKCHLIYQPPPSLQPMKVIQPTTSNEHSSNFFRISESNDSSSEQLSIGTSLKVQETEEERSLYQQFQKLALNSSANASDETAISNHMATEDSSLQKVEIVETTQVEDSTLSKLLMEIEDLKAFKPLVLNSSANASDEPAISKNMTIEKVEIAKTTQVEDSILSKLLIELEDLKAFKNLVLNSSANASNEPAISKPTAIEESSLQKVEIVQMMQVGDSTLSKLLMEIEDLKAFKKLASNSSAKASDEPAISKHTSIDVEIVETSKVEDSTLSKLLMEIEDLKAYKKLALDSSANASGELAILKHTATEDISFQKLLMDLEDLKAYIKEQSIKTAHTEQKLIHCKVEILQLKDYCARLESLHGGSGASSHMLEIKSSKDYGARLESLHGGSGASSHKLEIKSSKESLVDLDNTVLFFGGYDGYSWLSSLDAYSPSKDVYRSLEPMSLVRAYSSVAKLNGEFYVVGGGNGNLWWHTVESYNPVNDKWNTQPSLKVEKGSLATASVAGKIFAIGGGDGNQCFSSVEMLDLDVGRWIPTRSMLQKRFALGAAVLNGVIYAVGGFDGNNYLSTAERFDPREYSWSKISSMNSLRGSHSLVMLNEKLYALGGFDGKDMVGSVEVYDPRYGAWVLERQMNYARGYSSAVVLADSIYVFGGSNSFGGIVEPVEHYQDSKGWQVEYRNGIRKRCFASTIVF